MGWTNESRAEPPSANQSPTHSNLLISQLTIELLIYSELFTARCITFAPGRLLWRKLNCNIPTFLDKDRSYWDWLSSAWLALWWSPLNVDICNPLDPAMSPQYWPLIGQHRSRDINTKFSLVSEAYNDIADNEELWTSSKIRLYTSMIIL